ncbi:hypothetical protein [Actinomadura sp. NBRC 104425]|uniref:hypothetical protein n=1 Tax=Actinomadura sp. NBRC 104425 TaxID=3032204 RepID=UPI0025522487|nr:hypothetical protein [Actinomadura sp. NBRC 104425]
MERDGKALNYASRCVTHDPHEHYATYAAAYRAATTSAEWCPACTITPADDEYPSDNMAPPALTRRGCYDVERAACSRDWTQRPRRHARRAGVAAT